MNYISHLKKDKQLRIILKNQPEIKLKKVRNLFLKLCGSIASQQLSTKVAATIFNRFKALYENEPAPEDVMNTPDETLRSIGLSAAKVSYFKNLANFALDQGITGRKLNKMSDEELIGYLTQIKGIGRWSVEMLMMFAMGREDVFAVDDLGIQTAMANLYGLDRKSNKKLKQEMIEISKKWSPYRTYACIHLWSFKDNPPAL